MELLPPLGLVAVYELSSLVVVGLDRGSWVVPGAVRTFVGLPPCLVGAGLFLWGRARWTPPRRRSWRVTSAPGSPYAYARSPQYAGMVLGRVGGVLIANFRPVVVLGTLQVGWMSPLPLAEEPWLESRFGEAYERYREEVPRFVGRRSPR